MFVVSMKANRGMLVAVAAVGVALAMLLTRCDGAAATSGQPQPGVAQDAQMDAETTGFSLSEQGETNGTTG